MSGHSYETGRLNLPFVGLPTFGKLPIVTDWSAIEADVAVLGAPYDMGTQYRSGARFGPRAVREASTLFSFGHAGVYDHEADAVYLAPAAARIVDVGDADIIHTDSERSLANIEFGVRQILARRAMPVVIGGDHSITSATIKAFDQEQPMHVVHIDAHLDFVNERHGVRYGHGSPLRRASEMKHVTGITHLGIRGVSSSNRSDYDDARAYGSTILSVRSIRAIGVEKALASVPKGARCYVTIDIDSFDPSIAPGTGTPSHGGFTYYEVKDMLEIVARQNTVCGIDLVEVAPDYDHSGTTAFLAARILLDALGFIFHFRPKGA